MEAGCANTTHPSHYMTHHPTNHSNTYSKPHQIYYTDILHNIPSIPDNHKKDNNTHTHHEPINTKHLC